MLYNIFALLLHWFFMVIVFKVMKNTDAGRHLVFREKQMFKVYVNGIRRLIS